MDEPKSPVLSSDLTMPALQPVCADGPLDDATTFATRYVARDKLGEGGMGVVELYHDRRAGRDVAVKTLLDPAYAAHFVREARVQAQLEHPSIVPVYDLGRASDERPWFSMKRVRGMTLAEIVHEVRRGAPGLATRYSRRRLLTAFTSVCLAVELAHARGVIHRDLKPSNIMLGDFGEVYVLDWGVAAVGGAAEIVGTPGYMSPEQARGEPLDERADTYALGAILFEILTLEPLHPTSSPLEALKATVAPTGLERPSIRAPRASVPPELDDACASALAFDRAERPRARELCDVIERFLDGDRDIERRKALASEHVANGRREAERSREGGEGSHEARLLALQQFTRALALDPAQQEAAASVAHILVDPPAESPPEVEAQIAVLMQRERRLGVRLSLLSNLLWIAFLPLLFAMGVVGMVPVLVSGIAFAAVTASAVWLLRLRAISEHHGAIQLALTGVLVASLSTVFGAFVLVPTLALALGVFFALMGRARIYAIPITVICALAAVLPALLEWLGATPTAYRFHDGSITILPQMVRFSPIPTRVFLLVANALITVTTLTLVQRYRSAMLEAERRLLVQAWHLRGLTPKH